MVWIMPLLNSCNSCRCRHANQVAKLLFKADPQGSENHIETLQTTENAKFTLSKLNFHPFSTWVFSLAA